MSTTKDFENAPVGATASTPYGNFAVKTFNTTSPWRIELNEWHGYTMNNSNMATEGYTLNPTAPTTAHEAFDLTWNLAHEVKEGQAIPKGMRYVRRYQSGDLATFISNESWIPRDKDNVRTQDPIPEPEPDWLNAPAVLARHKDWDKKSEPKVFERISNGLWSWDHFVRAEAWDLRDVTPLYPKEEA